MDVCVSCKRLTERGKFPRWAVVLAVLLFPIGMLFLLVGRNPTFCTDCSPDEPNDGGETNWGLVVFFTVVVVVVLLWAASSHARVSHGGSYHAPRVRAARTYSARTSGRRIHRDPRQRAAFMRSHPCPSTGRTHGACPGYVVDHVRALKHGGADTPSNMQWQTVQDAKAKDRWE